MTELDFNVRTNNKVIQRRDLGLKSQPKECRSWGRSCDPWTGSPVCYPLHYRRSYLKKKRETKMKGNNMYAHASSSRIANGKSKKLCLFAKMIQTHTPQPVLFTHNRAELQWLERLWNHEKLFETGVVRANKC